MLTSHSILDQLQHEYKEATLTPKHRELVSDREIKDFIVKRENFWSALFWIAFIGAILLTGVVGR